MESGDAVREYLLLALRLDRLLPGTVGTYGGDPELARRVSGEPRPVPSDLVRAAGRLAATVADPDVLPAERGLFLRGQVRALEWTARRLTGQAVPYVHEVAAAFDTWITLGPPDAYRDAHRELAAVLPGSAPLAQRLAEHRRRDEIPRDRLGAAVAAMSTALRERTLARVPLPAGESVEFRIVDDAPWSALHHYAGGGRSVVTVNAGARIRWAQLAPLVAHEAYPGHHTERCRKEVGLVARGWGEHSVVLANAPQSLIAEGAADLGLGALVGPRWGRFAAEVLAEMGARIDGELAERVGACAARLGRVRQDAALLLHDRRAPTGDVLAHLRRWLLVGEDRARRILRFVRHPLWRAHTTAYVEGSALLRGWLEQPGPDRLLRVLDEPLTPSEVRAEQAGTPGRRATERVRPTTIMTTGGVHDEMNGRPFC